MLEPNFKNMTVVVGVITLLSAIIYQDTNLNFIGPSILSLIACGAGIFYGILAGLGIRIAFCGRNGDIADAELNIVSIYMTLVMGAPVILALVLSLFDFCLPILCFALFAGHYIAYVLLDISKALKA